MTGSTQDVGAPVKSPIAVRLERARSGSPESIPGSAGTVLSRRTVATDRLVVLCWCVPTPCVQPAAEMAEVSPTTTDVIGPSRRARGGSRLRCASCPVGTTGRPRKGNSKGRTLGPPGPTSVRWHTRGPLRATTGGCMATTWTAHSRMWGTGPLRKGPVAAMFLRGAGRRRPLQTSHALLAGLEQIAEQTLTADDERHKHEQAARSRSASTRAAVVGVPNNYDAPLRSTACSLAEKSTSYRLGSACSSASCRACS
jgi:hypothetical protein